MQRSASPARRCAALLLAAAAGAFAQDPSIAFSTFLGATAGEKGWALAADPSGALYVAAGPSIYRINREGTSAAIFATAAEDFKAIGVDSGGNVVAARGQTVTRWSASGTQIYSVQVQGAVAALAVAPAGDAFLTGMVNTARLQDVFITRLSASGQQTASITFGGEQKDEPRAIALDSNGNIYVTGFTLSTASFPLVNPLQSRPGDLGLGDAFLVKYNASLTSPVYSTYIGWDDRDEGNAVTVDAQGAAYVTGLTGSITMRAASAFQSLPGGSYDAFVAKIAPDGRSYHYLTYLGGAGADYGQGIAVDASGAAWITGDTFSTNFPLKNALQSSYGGKGTAFGDAFVAKIAPDGKSLLWSTYLGGASDDHGNAAAADLSGCVSFTGFTSSAGFPVRAPLQGAYGGGASDAYVLKACPPSAPGPVLAAAGIVNAFSLRTGPIAPGVMLLVQGSGFGPNTPAGLALDPAGRIATAAGGVRLLFDGVPAPILWVAKDKALVIAPYALAGRSATSVRLEAAGVLSNAVDLAVDAAAPAILTAGGAGTGPVYALAACCGVVSSYLPAAPGASVIIFGTGEGQTNPPGQDGAYAAAGGPAPLLPVQVDVAGRPAAVRSAGAIPGAFAGLFMIVFDIPQDAPSGDALLLVRVGNAASQSGLTIPIK